MEERLRTAQYSPSFVIMASHVTCRVVCDYSYSYSCVHFSSTSPDLRISQAEVRADLCTYVPPRL
jgi:hypothetical protein